MIKSNDKQSKKQFLKILYCSDLDGGLIQAIETLQAILQNIPEECRLSANLDYGYDGEYECYYKRVESDEEYDLRVANEEVKANNDHIIKIAQYEKLKKELNL